jgi:signal transduction histidine kinase
VLDVAKIEAGHQQLNEISVNPADLIQRCLRMIRPRADTAGIRLCNTNNETLPALKADETKLQQVLLNLLSNAVKFTPSGGEVRIEAEVSPFEGMALKISDTGIGIASTDLERIFEPFEQVDSELNRKFDGTGLGLHLARAFMELHGGGLTVESSVGRGTTVVVRIPAERLLFQAA